MHRRLPYVSGILPTHSQPAVLTTRILTQPGLLPLFQESVSFLDYNGRCLPSTCLRKEARTIDHVFWLPLQPTLTFRARRAPTVQPRRSLRSR